ncbi:uncharacterized protein FA14DRAFT_178393 [Meira miltonrushii]|uniref:Uncharacterized protein n=1 Tax=Meira miltonrushii TaxID=1280837 RepID=A0A316VHM7_9BASI|nr:uncharacterized protein FA14DRAFT_178393 [Meira miltonrushii]PWN35005.1 hypothetical protein FA14DRAFT_178393 [Meira miltonrushii]
MSARAYQEYPKRGSSSFSSSSSYPKWTSSFEQTANKRHPNTTTTNDHLSYLVEQPYYQGQYSEMPISRAAKRLAALTQLEGNTTNEERNDWWENVLPPGQLVDRLKRTQSNPSTSHLEEADDGPRHSRKSILRSSNDGKKVKQHSSNTLPRSASSTMVDDHSSSMYLSPPSQGMRAGTWSSQSSSYGSYPTPSTRSSISVGEMSSSSSSNDESPSERRSPILGEDWSSMLHGFGDRSSGATSPTSITRSKTNRRRRFIGSDDGTGLGVTIRGAKGSVVDLDERLRQWNNGVPFTNAERLRSSSSAASLRPFPSSRQSRSGSLLYDTPEHSSAEEDHHGSYYGNQRFPRTSSTRTSDTVRESIRTKAASLASAPSSRRSSITAGHHGNTQSYNPSRRVSFSQEVEVVQSNDVKKVQTIGRAHGRSMSTLSDKHGMGYKPIATPQARTHASNLRAQEAVPPTRGKRSTCYSAPTSPRMAAAQFAAAEAKERSSRRLSRETTPTSSGRSTPRTRSRRNSINEEEDADVARLAVLSNSLGVAHTQLSSARSLAMALTRQLSAPLRPFFHLTLLVSISSVAFVALASFLFAGYMCTVWDDVNSRGKSLQNNVTSARKTLESRVQWTRTLLGISSSEEKAGTEQTNVNEPEPVKPADNKTQSALVRFVFALPIAVAQSLIPSVVGNKDSHSTHTTSAPPGAKRPQSTRRAGRTDTNAFNTLPPRPPLSSLLPSIAFTIVIAFGAGLASFFANRAAAPASAGDTPHPSVSASGRNAASGSQASIAASSRRHGHHRFDSSSSSRMSVPVQPSAHARQRSSHSISESTNSSGRKSPYSWQEGVSAFS